MYASQRSEGERRREREREGERSAVKERGAPPALTCIDCTPLHRPFRSLAWDTDLLRENRELSRMAEEDGTREMKAGVAASCSDEDRGSKFFGDSVQDRYHIGRILGEGAFSVVRKAKRRVDGYVCALKVIDKKESGSTDLKNEIEILCKVNHPNCVAFYEWTEVRTGHVSRVRLSIPGNGEIISSKSELRIPNAP